MKTLRIITKTAASWLQFPTFWIVNCGVILVCFLSGPFGTLDALPGGFRLIYWGAIVLTTSGLALWVHALILCMDWRTPAKVGLISIIFGLLVAGIVILISLSLLPPISRYPGHLQLFGYSFPTASLTFMISVYLMRGQEEVGGVELEEHPVLLQRLEKLSMATTLLSLSAQDHYVEVVTELGAELCLIRLADAIAETAPQDGFQIHRSHWVARKAIRNFDNHGATGKVTLIDGRKLTVSQSRVTAFRKYLSENNPPQNPV